MVEHLNEETFRSKIFNYEKHNQWNYVGSLPALVDFWAPWCGPCKIIGPILDELSNEYAGKVSFYKVNTEIEQDLAGVFNIQSIPSLLFVPVGGDPKMAIGALPKKELKRLIDHELIRPIHESRVAE
jgi:thioredoxin 1